MFTESFEWARYHAYSARPKRRGSKGQYLMDIFDIHPKLKIRLANSYFQSIKTKKKIPVYIHIPKTGGTYLTHHNDWNKLVALNHMLLRDELSDRYIPIGLTGTKWRPTNRHILFTTVRNPLTFFRSYYHHVIGHGQYHNSQHYDFNNANKGFDYLVRKVMDREDYWPSRKFLFPQLFDQSGNLVVQWINRNESLSDDVQSFGKKFGHKFNTPCDKKRSAPVGNIRDYFSVSLEKLARNVFWREFELFGYSDDARSAQNILVGDVSFASVTYDYVTDDLTMSNL